MKTIFSDTDFALLNQPAGVHPPRGKGHGEESGLRFYPPRLI